MSETDSNDAGRTQDSDGGNAGADFTDPNDLIFDGAGSDSAAASSAAGAASGRKRRSDAGTKRGPRGAKKAEKVSLDLSAYVGIWAGLHAQIAILTGEPTLAINEVEARTFLTAAQNVMRHYAIQSTQKTLDWAALAFVTGAIYAPRISNIVKRRRHHVVVQQPVREEPRPTPTEFVMPEYYDEAA